MDKLKKVLNDMGKVLWTDCNQKELVEDIEKSISAELVLNGYNTEHLDKVRAGIYSDIHSSNIGLVIKGHNKHPAFINFIGKLKNLDGVTDITSQNVYTAQGYVDFTDRPTSDYKDKFQYRLQMETRIIPDFCLKLDSIDTIVSALNSVLSERNRIDISKYKNPQQQSIRQLEDKAAGASANSELFI